MNIKRLFFEPLKTHQILGVRTDAIDGIFERQNDKGECQIVIVVNNDKALKNHSSWLMTFYRHEEDVRRIEGVRK